jgi:hypothetical protein
LLQHSIFKSKSKLKMIRITVSLFFALQWFLLTGQVEHFSYIHISLTSESSPIAEIMKGNYEKEFYYNPSSTVFIKRAADNFELHFYDSTKTLTRIYMQIDKENYVWDDPILIDDNYNELTDEQKLELPKFYTISRDNKKKIEGFDCFKVVMRDPEDTEGNSVVEMYVTESLPNFPFHFPLSSAILSAEPLELSMDIYGTKITFGIVSHESGIDLVNQLDISPDKAIQIDQDKYYKLKL